MLDLTPQQVAALERLRGAGFAIAAFPMYASHLAAKRGDCAVLLAPVEGAGMRVYGEACYLVKGQMGVRLRRDGRDWFVWKKDQVEATPERVAALQQFVAEVRAVLGAAPPHPMN